MLTKKIISVLFLICLINFVSAGTLVVVDTTENYKDISYVYDDGSYNAMYNITGSYEYVLDGSNYTIFIQPTKKAVLGSPTNKNFLNYWWDYMRLYFFIGIFIIVMVMATWRIYKKR